MGAQHPSGGIFDLDSKNERLTEVVRELEDSEVWNNPERAQELGRERVRLEEIVLTLNSMSRSLLDASELLEFAAEENDQETLILRMRRCFIIRRSVAMRNPVIA